MSDNVKKSYNNGSIIEDIFSADSIELSQMAKDFAEGSEELESVLLYLWQNKIETIACCAGHEKNHNCPYVFFNVDKIDSKRLKNLLIDLSASDFVCERTYARDFNYRPETLQIQLTHENRESDNARVAQLLGVLKRAFTSQENDRYYKEQYKALSEDAKKFIEDVMILRQMQLSKINLSSYRQYYKYLPSNIEISSYEINYRNEKSPRFQDFGSLDYSNGFNNKYGEIESGFVSRLTACYIIPWESKGGTTCEYYDVFIGKPQFISKEEAQARGILGSREYEDFLYNKLFPQSRETLLKLYEMAKAQGALTPEGLAAQESGQMGE